MEIRRERSPAPGMEAGVFEGQCVDLSRVGTCFRTRELFHPHEKLELEFYSADGESELHCEIEVVRSVRISRQYEVGGRITRIYPSSTAEPSGEDPA